MDSQQIEIAGRNRLVSELLAASIEVARPERDRGIDLIAYLDRRGRDRTFRAIPIQMKASSAECFSINAKYRKTSGLIMAYIWHIATPDRAVTYAISYTQALQVASRMRYTNTESWRRGSYFTSRPSVKLRELLNKHRATPQLWRNLVEHARRI